MPQVVYPNEFEIDGPILISAEALAELDKAISEALPKLAETQSQFIAEIVNTKLNALSPVMVKNERYFEERKKKYNEEATAVLTTQTAKVTLRFSDGSELQAQSFAEAANHERLTERTAIGFEVHARSGKVQAHMECFKRTFGTRLSLEVSPSYEAGRDLFIALRRWVKDIEAPWWQRLWHKLGVPGFVIVMLSFALAVGMLQASAFVPSSSYYRHQADELAKTGVKTPENERRALELLLAIAAKSPTPPDQRPLNSRKLGFLLAGLVLILLIAVFPPKLVIGLGHGEASLKYWRWWIRIVSVSVPGFFLTGFVLPYLIDTIKRLWS